MVTVILILMVLLAMAMAVVWYTSLQLGAARNLNARQTALNAAHAGVQHARDILGRTGNWGQCLTSHMMMTDGGLGDDIPDQTHPTRRGAVLWNDCAAPSGTDCNVTGPLLSCSYAVNAGDAGLTTLGSYTVWIRNNQGQILAGQPTTPNLNGVVVRSEGRDASGVAAVVVEAALAQSVTQGLDINKYSLGKNVNAFNTGSSSGAVNWNP
jgi:hypothetical protein